MILSRCPEGGYNDWPDYLVNREGPPAGRPPFFPAGKKDCRQIKKSLRVSGGGVGAQGVLGRVLDSAFIQARVRLNCSNILIYTGLHMSRCHASPPRATADGVD